MKKQSLKPDIVNLPDGTRGAWLGDKSEGTVVLWLHGNMRPDSCSRLDLEAVANLIHVIRKGGGYAAPLTSGHVQLIYDFLLAARSRDVMISCFFLEYGTSGAIWRSIATCPC